MELSSVILKALEDDIKIFFYKENGDQLKIKFVGENKKGQAMFKIITTSKYFFEDTEAFKHVFNSYIDGFKEELNND